MGSKEDVRRFIAWLCDGDKSPALRKQYSLEWLGLVGAWAWSDDEGGTEAARHGLSGCGA